MNQATSKYCPAWITRDDWFPFRVMPHQVPRMTLNPASRGGTKRTSAVVAVPLPRCSTGSPSALTVWAEQVTVTSPVKRRPGPAVIETESVSPTSWLSKDSPSYRKRRPFGLTPEMPTSTDSSASGPTPLPHDALQLIVARREPPHTWRESQSLTFSPRTSEAVTVGWTWSAIAAGAPTPRAAASAAVASATRLTGRP